MLMQQDHRSEWTTDQIFHDTIDNFTGVGTADKNDRSRVLDFLRFTGLQGPFGSRILGLADCGLAVSFPGNAEMRTVTHTTRSMVEE